MGRTITGKPRGRPKSEREAADDKWLQDFLHDGPLQRHKIVEAAKAVGIYERALKASKSRLDIANMQFNGVDGDYWIDITPYKIEIDITDRPTPEREKDDEFIAEVFATEEELIEVARRHRNYCETPDDCIAHMLQFAMDHPATPPVGLDRLHEIAAQYGPRIKTPEEQAEDVEVERLAQMLPSDFEQWTINFRESRRRAPTPEEIEARRVANQKSLQASASELRIQIMKLPEQTVELTWDEINAMPEVVAFFEKHAKNGELPKSRTKELKELQKPYVGKERKYTSNEIAEITERLEVQIAEHQIQQAQINEASLTKPISTMTEDERKFLERVRRVRDSRPEPKLSTLAD